MKQDIRMVDLKGQYESIKEEIDEALRQVIESTAFIKGPDVSKFAANLAAYLGSKHVIPCANGTDALQLAMMALDLKPGDEIITTPFTFISTIEVIKLLNLQPVLADIDERSFNLDPEKVKEKTGARTRAIVPVHLFGQCADMSAFQSIASNHNLHIIEDTAQALGADYISEGRSFKAGTIGDIGCTSFFPSKNLGAYGDGGAVYTNNDEIAGKITAMANHGMVRKYHYDFIGINSRLDSLQAAILSVKLNYLDKFNNARKAAAQRYSEALEGLPGIVLPGTMPWTTHIFHQYTLRITGGKRDALKEFLWKNNIPSMIYYPLGLHLQKAYLDLGYRKGNFPVTEKLCEEVLSLPMHSELTEEQTDFITTKIKEFFS
jgi:dTDP-4-amino-4,6-dideoxygalactose transaminase